MTNHLLSKLLTLRTPRASPQETIKSMQGTHVLAPPSTRIYTASARKTPEAHTPPASKELFSATGDLA